MTLEQSDAKCIEVQQMVFNLRHRNQPVNSFEPHAKPTTVIREDGICYRNDICYGTEYPNSYMDIWYPDEDTTVSRPTVVYFHGGGFLFGDKDEGDPLMGEDSSHLTVLVEMVKQGYNIVNANYALAPEYRFPVQIHQVNQVMDFLVQNGSEYALNSEEIVLMGGSAGADMTEIYGLVLADAEYAKMLNIMPDIACDKVKALVINEAALSVESFEENMTVMLQTWMGVDDLCNSNKAGIMNAAAWIRECYIPSFIITSNLEPWFIASAGELAEALKKTGISYELFYREQSCDQLEHGFMDRMKHNIYARECFDHMMCFLKKILQG